MSIFFKVVIIAGLALNVFFFSALQTAQAAAPALVTCPPPLPSTCGQFTFEPAASGDVRYPYLLHLAGEAYLLAYADGGKARLKTVRIRQDGGFVGLIDINNTLVLDIKSLTEAKGRGPKIIPVAGAIYALAYEGVDGNGHIKTIEVTPDGYFGDPSIPGDGEKETFKFTSGGDNGKTPDIIHIADDIYAVVYYNGTDRGHIGTIRIPSTGTAMESKITESFPLASSSVKTPEILKVSGSTYVVAYSDSGNDGWVATMDISPDGQTIDFTKGTSVEFDNVKGINPDIRFVSGNIYAVAYTGSGDDGFIKTFEILPSIGATPSKITQPPQGSLTFDGNTGKTPFLFKIAGTLFSVAYQGPGSDGFLRNINITSAGSITFPVPAEFVEFDTSFALNPHLINIADNVFALAYRGQGGAGIIKTLTIAPYEGGYEDCGLHYANGPTSIIAIACETKELPPTSPLRIAKAPGDIRGIVLVIPNDPKASKIRIQTTGGIKALRKL